MMRQGHLPRIPHRETWLWGPTGGCIPGVHMTKPAKARSRPDERTVVVLQGQHRVRHNQLVSRIFSCYDCVQEKEEGSIIQDRLVTAVPIAAGASSWTGWTFVFRVRFLRDDAPAVEYESVEKMNGVVTAQQPADYSRCLNDRRSDRGERWGVERNLFFFGFRFLFGVLSMSFDTIQINQYLFIGALVLLSQADRYRNLHILILWLCTPYGVLHGSMVQQIRHSRGSPCFACDHDIYGLTNQDMVYDKVLRR